MDNGLIFPYRQKIVNTYLVILTTKTMTDSLLGLRFFGDRGNLSGAVSVLTGVTQEGSQAGRWLSRSKSVGLTIGKSVVYVPET